MQVGGCAGGAGSGSHGGKPTAKLKIIGRRRSVIERDLTLGAKLLSKLTHSLDVKLRVVVVVTDASGEVTTLHVTVSPH
jgi:hypothetical protein